MEDCLVGIKNFLEIINNNWTTIIVILGLVVGLVKKIKIWMEKSDEERVSIAKKQIRETLLNIIADSEINYEHLKQSGQLKRSEVISKIYKEYPILKKVVNQNELIEWIDQEIDDALPILREVIESNNQK